MLHPVFLFCQLTFVFYREETIFISSWYLTPLFKCLKKQYSENLKNNELQASWIDTNATTVQAWWIIRKTITAKHPDGTCVSPV